MNDFKGDPEDVDNALTGINEKILYKEANWCISVQDNPFSHITKKTIDVWHWCRNRGEHPTQYAASAVADRWDIKLQKDIPYIDDVICWNCKNQETVSIEDKTIPKQLRKVADGLLTGSQI